MRINILTTEFKPYPGGVATYVFNIANEFIKQGHEVNVLVFFNYGEVVAIEGHGYRVVNICQEKFKNFKLIKVAWWIYSNRAKYKADCWIAADYRVMVAASYISLPGVKFCVMHGTDAKAKLLRLFNYLPFLNPFSRFSQVVCNSTFTKNLVLNYQKKVDPRKVVVSYLGSGEAKSTDVDFRAAMCLEGKFILLSVGRIEERKGIEYSIKAVSALPLEIKSNLVYLIVGKVVDKDYYNLISNQIDKVGAVVRYLGVVDENLLTSLYERSDLFLHTAIKSEKSVEGFGLVLVEAAKYGLPVIATEVDAIPEVVIDGKTGFLVKEKDVEAISAKILELYSNRERLRSISDFSIKNSTVYSWEKHIKVFLND